jgi:hypothetical protein
MTQSTHTHESLKSKSLKELKSIAKDLQVPGYTKFKADDAPALIDAILKATPTTEALTYPFASSEDVPAGAYCNCGENVPLNEDSTLSITKCTKCGFDFTSSDVDFSTAHGTHVLIHKIGHKPDVCPLDGERLDVTSKTESAPMQKKSEDVASATTSSREGVWAKADISNDVLNYENSAGVSFSLNLSELDKLKERFGDSYGSKALVKSVELPCVPGCDSTWSPRASFVEKIIMAVKTGDDILMIHPVDPRHNDCWTSYCRSSENMLASARTEKIETPTAEELSELKKHPWSIEDGRVWHNNGDPTMAFSFDVEDAETHENAIAHLHKCHGPRCKFMIRTYAGWALTQARLATDSKDFAFLSSFAPKHESCKQQAKEIRNAERAELEAQETASEPTPAPKVEDQAPVATKAPVASEPTPAPKVEDQAPVATKAPVASDPAPTPAFMPDVHASAPAEFVDTTVQPAPATEAPSPVATSPAVTSEIAQIISALGSVIPKQNLSEIATILQALPAQQEINVAGILTAAASITDKQTATLGKVAEAAQAQLGDVVKKLIDERTATVRAVDDIPRRVRSEIFGDMEQPGGMHEVGQHATGSRTLSVERPSSE